MYCLGGNDLALSYVVNPILQVINLCLDYDLVTEKRPLSALYELFIDKLKNPMHIPPINSNGPAPPSSFLCCHLCN